MIMTTRAFILALIVYYATTVIPTTPIQVPSKILVAATVVIFYVFIDYLFGKVGTIHKATCRTVCDSYSGNDSEMQVTDAQAEEIKDIEQYL